jgi:hydrogenase expression/formation protein HypC
VLQQSISINTIEGELIVCLAIPALIVEIKPEQMALVDLDGIRQLISTELIDEVQVGDYVIVHVGHALAVIDPLEAAETLALFSQLKSHTDLELKQIG